MCGGKCKKEGNKIKEKVGKEEKVQVRREM